MTYRGLAPGARLVAAACFRAVRQRLASVRGQERTLAALSDFRREVAARTCERLRCETRLQLPVMRQLLHALFDSIPEWARADALGSSALTQHHPFPQGEEMYHTTPDQSPAQGTLFPAALPAVHRPYRVPIYRVTLVRESRLPHTQPQMRSSREAAVLFRQYLGAVDREHFLVAMLDQKNKVIGINTVSMGSLTASVVHPREVMKPAILSNAASLLCCHNHPSGNPQPSQEDRTLTKRLVDAGKLLGVAVLDHLILGDGTETYFSFADEQLL
jgi:DNA repair protein RadC